MALNSVRLFVLSFFYYFGFAYASFQALKERSFISVESPASPAASTTDGALGVPRRRPPVQQLRLGLPALKLMIMVTSMALLSIAGADMLPLFAELRLIFLYTLLFAPPFTQRELYDQYAGPLLVRGGSLAISLQTSDFLSRRVALWAVRRCVGTAVALMNYVERCGTVEAAAVRDIMGGLVFSRRALQQTEEMTREADGKTYAQLAKNSNFAVDIFTSKVRRILREEYATVGGGESGGWPTEDNEDNAAVVSRGGFSAVELGGAAISDRELRRRKKILEI